MVSFTHNKLKEGNFPESNKKKKIKGGEYNPKPERNPILCTHGI